MHQHRRGSRGYPSSLESLKKPPEAVRIRGKWPSLARSVAIVGTRAADPLALSFTNELARELAEQGVTIVSGGARGIDRAAHEGALVAGRTVAVLPTGFAPPYPPQHGQLFDRIARAGALLTELPDGTPPRAGLFLARNRLVAALATIVVVVQAPSRSGALSTAAHAREIGRPVLACPASPWDARGAGCAELIRRGAGECHGARDVLSLLGAAKLAPAEEAVLAAMTERALYLDAIASKAGLVPRVTSRALLRLVALGRVVEAGPSCYARRDT